MFVLLFCWLLSVITYADDGVELVKYRANNGAVVSVVRADAQAYQLALVSQSDFSRRRLLDFLDDVPQAIALINGGFFERSGRPNGFFKSGKWIVMSQKMRGVIGFGSLGVDDIMFDRLTVRDGQIVSRFTDDGWWHKKSFVLGGAPLMMRDGHRLDYDEERLRPSFSRRRYARSAFCVHQSGDLMFISVYGGDRHFYKAGMRMGLSLSELQDFLVEIGCRNAINLDGGYSSSMVYDGRAILGHWFQYVHERPVSNALALIPRKSS